MQVDLNAKYALLLQTPGKIPVSVSYFGNAVMDTRNKTNFRNSVDRYSYFSEVIIARKITEKFSAQVAPNFSWFNNVEGYVDSKGMIRNKMHNGHFAVSLAGRYKISAKIGDYCRFRSTSYSNIRQIILTRIFVLVLKQLPVHMLSRYFLETIQALVPQSNNMFNQNDYTKGQFVLGFNITKIWNF